MSGAECLRHQIVERSFVSDFPLVSIVVTTKNEEAVLPRLFETIGAQTYSNVEVLLVDNDSSDRTKDIGRRHGALTFDYGPERSSQRNFGARKAKGDYLLFLDADMELSPTVVAECMYLALQERPGEQPDLGGIIIPEVSYGCGLWAKVKAFERSFYVDDDAVESARFFPRRIFMEIGAYDERLTGPEDWDLSERVRDHYRIGHIRAVIRHNEGKPTLLRLAKKSYYYARHTRILLAKRKMSVITPRTVYFLRPCLYRKWRIMVRHPALSIGMFTMLAVQLAAGALSFYTHSTPPMDE